MDASYTGNKIMQLRKQHNMTQKDLAELLSVTDKAVSKWERGLNFPDLLTLEKAARVLDSSVVELLGIEDHTKEQVASEIAEIANSEKQYLLKQIHSRGWLIIVTGILLYISLIYTDKMLYDRGVYGINVLGKATWLGLIVGCAGVSVASANRLMGKQTLLSKFVNYFRKTVFYRITTVTAEKITAIAGIIRRHSPINLIIDYFYKEK